MGGLGEGTVGEATCCEGPLEVPALLASGPGAPANSPKIYKSNKTFQCIILIKKHYDKNS